MKLKYLWQRLTRGWDDRELWNLDYSLAVHILPRLKAFRERFDGIPGDLSEEEWKAELDKMIAAFEVIGSDNGFVTTPEVDQELQEGLDLFARRFRGLWT